MPAAVLISEVGPRNGLQGVQANLATAHKLAWVSALHAAGLPPGFVDADGRSARAEVRA